jgi:DNA modification methylase
LPPPEYQPRILIPFAGSGSEMIGALLAGWYEIVGIEMEQEYCEIAEARLKWWAENNNIKLDGHKVIIKEPPKRNPDQLPLW